MKRKMKGSKLLKSLPIFLLLFSIIPTVLAITVREDMIVRTTDNSARFRFHKDFNLTRVEVNSTHIGMAPDYVGAVTCYIWVVSPDDTLISVQTWFPQLGDTYAKLRVDEPADANITFKVQSNAFATNVTVEGATQSWSYDVSARLVTVVTEAVSTIIIRAGVGALFYPTVEDVLILDMEGTGAWVVAEGRYYTFRGEFRDADGWEDLDVMKIRFSDGIFTAIVSYSATTGLWTVESGEEIISIKQGATEAISEYSLQVTYPVYFTAKVSDAYGIDLYGLAIDTMEYSSGWVLARSDYFSIYSLGGYVETFTSGTAGRIAGGAPFELYADYQGGAGVASANITYNRFQHIHFLVHLKSSADYMDTYDSALDYFEFILYVCIEHEWMEEFKVRIDNGPANEVEVTGPWWNPTAANYTAMWNVTWWHRGELIKQDTLSSYFGVPTQEGLDVGYASFWVDLWLPTENASTLVAGRVNSEYWGITDKAIEWLRWLVGSDWGTVRTDTGQSMFSYDLQDSDGDLLSMSEITMYKVGVRLHRGNNVADEVWTLMDYDVWDTDEYPPTEVPQGVATPIFVATKSVMMPQTGFLAALASAWGGFVGYLLNGLNLVRTAIVDGLTVGWDILLTAMQRFLAWLMPYLTAAWTTIWNWLITLPYLGPVFEWFGSAIGFLVTAATNILSMIGSMFTFFINVITFPLLVFTTVMGYLLDMWNGTGYFEGIPMSQFMVLGGIMFTYYIIRAMSEGDSGPLIDTIRIVWGVFAAIFGLGFRLLEFVADRILGGLPI